MGNPFNRLALLLSQILFSIITPFLLMPGIAKKAHEKDSVFKDTLDALNDRGMGIVKCCI